jgi:hypothetical protein
VADEIREMKAFINAHRPQEMPFDIVVEGGTSIDDPKEAAAAIRSWEDAGATWWIEAMWSTSDLETVLARIRHGPPRAS